MLNNVVRLTCLSILFLILCAPGLHAAGAGTRTTETSPGVPDEQLDPKVLAVDRYNSGAKALEKAAELETEIADGGGAKVEKLMGKLEKQYEKARRSFTSAVELDPDLFQAHSNLGYALRKLGRYDESLAAYDRALEIEPRYTNAIEYRAEAYLGLNRLEEAKQAYMDLFRSNREHADMLLAAMRRWVDQRTADPAGVDPTVVAEFAEWLEERIELSDLTPAAGDQLARAW